MHQGNYKYLHIAGILRNALKDHRFSHGDKFFTEESLSSQYQVSRQTVRKALGLLESENLLICRQGSGTYVNKPRTVAPATMTISVIPTYISEYIFPSILRGIEEVLKQNRYKLNISATNNRLKDEYSILSEIIAADVDGLIIEGTKTALPNPNLPLYREIQQAGVPMVFVHSIYPGLHDIVCVKMDDYAGGLQLTEYLANLGHKRIAGIFKSDDMQGIERYNGYLNGLQKTGLSFNDDNVLWYTTETFNLLFYDSIGTRLLSVLKDCTAVLCYNDIIAIRLINILRTNGLSVPDDISVVSFDNSAYCDLSNAPITSLEHPKERMGSIAAQKLLDLINGKPATSLTMQWEIVERASARSVK